MPASLLVGGLAGLATSVALAAGLRAGTFIGLLLLILAPLPSLVAGFGWGIWSAVAAWIAGAAVMAALGTVNYAITYSIVLGVPCAALTYLLTLSRPLSPPAVGRDWYPAGRLMAAIALIGGAVPLLILPMIGGTYAVLEPDFVEVLRQLSQLGKDQGQFAPFAKMTEPQRAQFAHIMTKAMPAMLAAYWTVLFAINVYLAGRVTRLSERLVRPWPDLAALTYPPLTIIVFGAALLAIVGPGAVSVVGTSLAGGLGVAFVVGGLAVVHGAVRGRFGWALWLLYGSLMLTIVGALVMLVMLVIGLLEPLIRGGSRAPPPRRPTGSSPDD